MKWVIALIVATVLVVGAGAGIVSVFGEPVEVGAASSVVVEVAAAAAAEVQALEAKVAVDQLMVEKVQTTRSYADHNCGFSMPQTTASTAGQE